MEKINLTYSIVQILSCVDLEVACRRGCETDLVIEVERKLQVILTWSHSLLAPVSLSRLFLEDASEACLFETIRGTDEYLQVLARGVILRCLIPSEVSLLELLQGLFPITFL